MAGSEQVAARDALRYQDQTARLAHELANLLDGSLRHVSLAISSINHSPDEAVLDKLNVANEAMHQMVGLLRQWMGSGLVQSDYRQGSMRDAVEHAKQLLAPLAQAKQVVVTTDVSSDVADLRVSSVFTVVLNGLRNSLEAFDDQSQRWVRLQVIEANGDVVLTIHDSGPGFDSTMVDDQGQVLLGKTTKPTGHGLGLVLSRDIIRALGGDLTVTPGSNGGAILSASFPRPAGPE